VVYEGLTGKDARALPDEAVVAGRKLSLPASRVRLLQQAAHETVKRFGVNKPTSTPRWDTLVSLAPEQRGYIAGLAYIQEMRNSRCLFNPKSRPRECTDVMKRIIFTPSTDPTPLPPTPLLLFIQRAQLALLYPEGTEDALDSHPAAPDLRDAA